MPLVMLAAFVAMSNHVVRTFVRAQRARHVAVRERRRGTIPAENFRTREARIDDAGLRSRVFAVASHMLRLLDHDVLRGGRGRDACVVIGSPVVPILRQHDAGHDQKREWYDDILKSHDCPLSMSSFAASGAA